MFLEKHEEIRFVLFKKLYTVCFMLMESTI